MLISDKKIRLWMSCAVLIGVGMAVAVLLNEPAQHERAASREVVIDMPAALVLYYRVEDLRCVPPSPPGFTDLHPEDWPLDNQAYCQALVARHISN